MAMYLLALFPPSKFILWSFFQAGKILMTFKDRRQRVKRFLIWGVVLVSIV